MPQPLAIFGLTTLLLGVCVVFATADLRLPGNDQGYEPDQPIAFSTPSSLVLPYTPKGEVSLVSA